MMRHLVIDFSDSYRWNLGKAHLICLDCLSKGGRRRQEAESQYNCVVEL